MNKVKAQATSVEMKEKQAEVKRQRALITNKFYPYLLKNTESVEDAKILLEMTYSAIQQVFQKKVMDYQTLISGDKLSTLDVAAAIKTGKEYDRERELFEMFKDETIGTADALLTGMKREIEGRIHEEGTKRKLDTVESDFLLNSSKNKTNEL